MQRGKEKPRPALAGAAAGAVEADSTTPGNEQKRSTKPQPRKYAAQRAWKKRNPLAVWAHAATRSAIRRGLLVPRPCTVCGDPKADAHHEQYETPLRVEWLCRRHHRQHHLAKEAGDGR